ncbi:hypothetical protein H6G36_11180 [Anabaena minutissima FACHB-250]|nr:hypothetical protein [Anabaena minutissima FACHB-250]
MLELLTIAKKAAKPIKLIKNAYDLNKAGKIKFDTISDVLELKDAILSKEFSDQVEKIMAGLANDIAVQHERVANKQLSIAQGLGNPNALISNLTVAASQFDMAAGVYGDSLKRKKNIKLYEAIFNCHLRRAICYDLLYKIALADQKSYLNDSDKYLDEFYKSINQAIYSFYSYCWHEIHDNKGYDFDMVCYRDKDIFNRKIVLTEDITDLQNKEIKFIDELTDLFENIQKWYILIVTQRVVNEQPGFFGSSVNIIVNPKPIPCISRQQEEQILEKEIFKCTAMKRDGMFRVYMNCEFIIKHNKIEFLGYEHPSISFEIPVDQLRDAKFKIPTFYLEDDLLIVLSNGKKYQIGFEKGDRDKALQVLQQELKIPVVLKGVFS